MRNIFLNNSKQRGKSMSRSANVQRNVTAALILQAIKMCLAFVNRIIFVRLMGATYLGINGLFSNVLSILSIADLGMYTVMMYCLYTPLAKKDEKKIASYVFAFNRIYNTIAIIVGVIGIAIMPFLKYIINLPEDVDGIYVYYLLMLINVSVSYLFVYKTAILQADQKSFVLDRIDMGIQIMLFFVQMAILYFTKNYTLYLGSSVLFTLTANILKTRAVKKRYGFLLKSHNRLEASEKVKLKDNIKSMFLYKIGGVIQSNTDNILTSIFVGTITVGYYSNYTMVILAITNFVSMVFNSLKASVGSFNAEKDRKTQETMFFNFEDYNYIIIGFCAICLYVLLPDFIKICFGEEYLLSTITLVFIILNFYTSNIRQNIWVYRETTGIFSKVKYTTLVTSSLNILLSIIGGIYFGIAGIVAATVVSRMIYSWWKEPSVLFRFYFNDSPKKYLLKYLVKLLYVGVIAAVLDLMVDNIVVDNEVLQFIIRIICTSVFSLLLLVLPIIRNESIRLLRDKYIFERKE